VTGLQSRICLLAPCTTSDGIGPQLGHDAVADLYTTFTLLENTKCIRVFEILAADTYAFDTCIRANVKVINLTEKPDFIALSYVWGDHQQSRTIQCDCFDINITRNCYDPLSYLRAKLGRLTI
jgi:hypothetical protein